MPLNHPLMLLFVLAIPIASVAWTVTHEEVFREPREWLLERTERARSIWVRKFFYLFTCEYCFSHWVTIALLFITRYKLAYDDWRGYLIAGFSLVWIANMYMSLFGRLRLEIKREKVEIAAEEAAQEQPGSVLSDRSPRKGSENAGGSGSSGARHLQRAHLKKEHRPEI